MSTVYAARQPILNRLEKAGLHPFSRPLLVAERTPQSATSITPRASGTAVTSLASKRISVA